MVEITSHDSPLAIFPESDFASFYSEFSKRLGFKPPVRITALEPAAWQEMSELIAKGNYDAVVRMADSRDPASSLNSLMVELPESDESYTFGKILADGRPIAIALMPWGNFTRNETYSTPVSITPGSILRAIRYESIDWLSISDAAKKSDLESILKQVNINGLAIADLAFLSVLDGVFTQLKMHHPAEHAKLFGKGSITIADIGCGFMPYGAMLAHYFASAGKNVTIVGIDTDSSDLAAAADYFKNHIIEPKPKARVKFVSVPYELKLSPGPLKQEGLEHFDLVTMLNPSDVIDIGDLPKSFRASALIFAALDTCHGYHDFDFAAGASREDVIRNLAHHGYMVLSENLNPYINELNRGFTHKYNPIIVAKTLSELLLTR